MSEKAGRAAMKNLTARELLVLEILATGVTRKEVADQLRISVGTVNTHAEHILQKTGAQSIGRAAWLYLTQ